MKRTAYFLSALLLFCMETLRAEVFTIDFNKGTSGGELSGFNSLPKNNLGVFCTEGMENIAEYSESNCFYRNTGCGIRIGKLSGSGQAYIIFTFSDAIQSQIIEKIVVYASRGTNNSDAHLEVYAGTSTVTGAFSFADMMAYDSSNPESSNYILPEILVGRKFKMLKIAARTPNFVMLHRIDIYTTDDEDAILLPRNYVDEMGVFYNLTGQRISKPLLGRMYIQGGRKYIVK